LEIKMDDKRASVDWTIGKLLKYVLLVLVLLVLIVGVSKGYNLPFEKIGAEADRVLILLNLKEGGSSSNLNCREFSLDGVFEGDIFLRNMDYLDENAEVNSLEWTDGDSKHAEERFGTIGLNPAIFESGTSRDTILKQCKKEPRCQLVTGQNNYTYSYEDYQVYTNYFRTDLLEGYFGEVYSLEDYRLKDNATISLFYWQVYHGVKELVEENNLESSLEDVYGDVGVFYGWAHNPGDRLMFAVENWWSWDIWYLYSKDNLREVKRGVSDGEMLEIFLENTDDSFDDELYYKEVSFKSSKNLFSLKDFLFKEENSLISNRVDGYPGDNQLDDSGDVALLRKFIYSNDRWGNVENIKRDDLRNKFEVLMGANIPTFQGDYLVSEIYLPFDSTYPLIILKKGLTEYALEIAPAPEGDFFGFKLRKVVGVDKNGFRSLEDVGYKEDYDLSSVEFYEKYLVTSVYELVEGNC